MNTTKKELIHNSLQANYFRYMIKMCSIGFGIVFIMGLLTILICVLDGIATWEKAFGALSRISAIIIPFYLLIAGYYFIKLRFLMFDCDEYVFYKTVLCDKSDGKIAYFNLYLTDSDGNPIKTRTEKMFGVADVDWRFHIDNWRYKEVVVAYSKVSKCAFVVQKASDLPTIDLNELNK